jgi:hypothetical protein
MGQPGTQRYATELSGNGTTPRHATTPEVKNHQRWIAKGSPWDPKKRTTQASNSLLTRTLPLAPDVGTAHADLAECRLMVPLVPSGEPLIRVRGKSSPCRLLLHQGCVGKQTVAW